MIAHNRPQCKRLPDCTCDTDACTTNAGAQAGQARQSNRTAATAAATGSMLCVYDSCASFETELSATGGYAAPAHLTAGAAACMAFCAFAHAAALGCGTDGNKLH